MAKMGVQGPTSNPPPPKAMEGRGSRETPKSKTQIPKKMGRRDNAALPLKFKTKYEMRNGGQAEAWTPTGRCPLRFASGAGVVYHACPLSELCN